MTSVTPKPRAGKHTKEPWDAYGSVIGLGAPNEAASKFIASCNSGAWSMTVCHTNARRIVACVNACEGVENAELEDLAALKCAIPGVAGVAQMAILNNTLEAANKELVEALRKIAGCQSFADGDVVDIARIALAKHGR